MIFVCVKSWENLTTIACTVAHLTCILWPRNPKSRFLTVSFIYTCTSDYFRYLRRKQTVISLSTTPGKMSPHYLVKCTTFFIWLKVCYIPPNVGGSEKSRLWVGIGGSEKNRLWCVANGMSGKQRYSKCSNWPPSARIHASSLFCHWSTASSTTLC